MLSQHKESIAVPPSSISIIIPAHNEAACIDAVLEQVFSYCQRSQLCSNWQVIVVDNASTDSTGKIAHNRGATVVWEPKPGYGEACWAGVQASSGDILLFVDADGAVNMDDATALLKALFAGGDLAIGTRTEAEPGALTLPQRWGNQLACALIRWIWQYPVQDLGPFRALRRDFFDQLNMTDRSYGWTVQMQINAHRQGAKVCQVPVRWHQRQGGQSKISGTVRGVIGAGSGIIGMIFRLWWRQRRPYSQQIETKTNPTRSL